MKTILVVDDRVDNRTLILAMLGHKGYHLLEAAGGEQGLEMARANQPDLIVAEILMPRMDGYEMVCHLRADPQLRAIPVVFLTAHYLKDESLPLAQACGVHHILVHPVSARELETVIERAFSQKAPAEFSLSPEFDLSCYRLVNDKLVQKVEELDVLSRKLSQEIQQRRAAQLELEQSQRQQELILNSAGEGVKGLDSEGRITFLNPRAAQLLGWPGDTLLGKPAHATLHSRRADGTHYPSEDCPICRSLESGASSRVTNDVFWRKNGTFFRVDYVVAPVKDRQGQLTGCIVTFKDITEQFMAEARLRLQQEQYLSLFQKNPNPMWIVDASSFRIIGANESAVHDYGYSREQLLKLNVRDLYASEPGERSGERVVDIRGAKIFSGEHRHRRRDQSELPVEVYSSPVLWEGVAARMLTAIDLTERKRAEARVLEQSEIIQHARDAIVVRDFETDLVTVWNPGAVALYGWTLAEALGRPLEELIHPDTIERQDVIREVLLRGSFHGEVNLVAKGGRRIVVDSSATLIRDQNGRPISVLSISADVTEKKQLELHLLRSQRLESIGTLASGVAHDLNNILTPILMCSEVLLNREDLGNSRANIELIRDSARRGASVVNQVLNFSRGAEGVRKTLDPAHLIQEMADLSQRTFPKGIAVQSQFPEDLWPVTGDPTQLHQVLLNLAVNARDALVHGGSIKFSASNLTIDQHYVAMRPETKIGPYVVFEVSDSGTGIAAEHVEKIFDPFFTTKAQEQGTGLGLSTVIGIVRSHGGFVTVQSEAGRGTVFQVFLPATPEMEDTGRAIMTRSLYGHGELLLVVDDHPGIIQGLQMILERSNYRVLAASDGLEALELYSPSKASIAAVVTDVIMPRMDGVAFVHALKVVKPDVVVIASHGREARARDEELKQLGVLHFLGKPYDATKLLQILRAALDPGRDQSPSQIAG